MDFEYLDIAGDMVEIVQETKTHRYLGRFLSGNLDERGTVEIRHRIQCAWMKFGQNARVLTNRKVSIKLRLKLFDAVVSPSLLSGVAALPISGVNMKSIDQCQRKMLRKIVGWIRHEGEEWEITMRRMKHRVENGLRQFNVKVWSERLSIVRAKFFARLESLPEERWEKLSAKWMPAVVNDDSQEYHAFRERGRPLLRWTDNLMSRVSP